MDEYKNKYDILLMLNEVEKSCNDGNYENAAGILLQIKDMNLENDTKIKFDKLWSDVNKKGVWVIYNEGNRLYKAGKYGESLPKLMLIFRIDPDLYLMPWITYQIGMCYKETDDNANALVFFRKVKDDYPKCKYVSSAERMINEIGNE